MDESAGGIAIFEKLAPGARHDVAAQAATDDGLSRPVRRISFLRQSIGQDDEQIEIAILIVVATRAAAELPDGAGLERDDQTVAEEGKRRGFILERPD